MRIIIFIMLLALLTQTAISQDEKPPSQKEIQAKMKETISKAKQQVADLNKQIAEAKANKEDPETIKQLEQRLATMEQMVAMLEKTNPLNNTIPKTLPGSKNVEPAYISPFTPINLKQTVTPPTLAQAKDKLLWYTGKKIDDNTLITTSGMIVRYDRQNNKIILQPNKTKDSTYYGLVNTLAQTKQMKTDFAVGIHSIMNSFFMFPEIEKAYKEFDLIKDRYYDLAKNMIEVPELPPVPDPNLEKLESKIHNLENYLRNLPSIRDIIPPPKRPNDLCMCEDPNTRSNYENELKSWISQFFAEELKAEEMLLDIYSFQYYLKQYKVIPASQSIDGDNYLIRLLERATSKLDLLLKKYDTSDPESVLLEDGLVRASESFEKWVLEYASENKSSFQNIGSRIENLIRAIRTAVFSSHFYDYITIQKLHENYNAVFDYSLYLSHEYNKKLLSPGYNVNDNAKTWIEGLKGFNRFDLVIKLDFDYQVVDKNDNDKVKMVANGKLESDHITVSLGQHDCKWKLYVTDADYRNRYTSGEEFKIPVTILKGIKDYLSDDKPPMDYTGPSVMRLVFPTFKISFCGGESTAMMDVLSYAPADLQRYKNDKVSDVYTIDMLGYANKMFISAKKTDIDVNKVVSNVGKMMNIQLPQLPQSMQDPNLDKDLMDYLMDKEKSDLQESQSQTTHTGKTVLKFNLSTSPPIVFAYTVDLEDPNDEDRKLGIMLIHGLVSLILIHQPN